jgi:hypothetical protein
VSGAGYHDFTREAPLMESIPVSAAQARDAALWLAGHARDTTDLRELLEACGLISYQPGKSRKYHWGEHRGTHEGALA